MKKLKVIFCLLLLTVVISLNVQVKAAIPDDTPMITSMQIIQTKTGTGPFDSNDEPGNDSSEDNNIVRSFDQVTWTIENTMTIHGVTIESYKGGKINFKASIPNDYFDKETFKWDLDSMAWIENPVISSDGLTLTGTYQMNEDVITVPGKQTLVFVGKVLGQKNGVSFKPTFECWLNDNDDLSQSAVGDEVTVSAAPNYNIKLNRNGNLNKRAIDLNYDGDNVSGRVYGYAIMLQLYNKDNPSKGLRGIEYPQGDITFDIDLKVTRQPVNGGEITDITDDATPLLWNYKINYGSPKIPNRNMSLFLGGNESARWYAPSGVRGDRLASVYNSGNINMVQDGRKLHVTVNNYGFDGTFPVFNREYHDKNAAHVYGENIGIFHVGYFQVIIPDTEATLAENSNFSFVVSDENFKATSISGQEITSQVITGDDLISIVYTRFSNGSFQQNVSLLKDTGSLSDYLHSIYNSGDGYAFVGQKFRVRNIIRINTNNDPDDYIQAVDRLLKFDADCYEPILYDDGSNYKADANMKFNVWYATKADGTNWTSQTEMNQAKVADLVLYNSIDDIPDGQVCVGMYYESYECKLSPSNDAASIFSRFQVKEGATLGRTYGLTMYSRYYREDLDRTVYSQTVKSDYSEYPRAAFDSGYRNYKKTEYNGEGSIVSGTHAGSYEYGQSLLLIGGTQAISQIAIDENDNEKLNYDLGKNQNVVTYKISPRINNSTAAPVEISGVTVTLTDTLPAGLTYVANSSNYGEPEITPNGDGTTTLVWNINDCTVGHEIEPLVFSASIYEETPNGKQYENVVVMKADDKVGNTTVVNRTSKYSIQIINLSSHRLYKIDTTPVIEEDGTIHFTLSYKNNTEDIIPDFQLLDILPYNGDGRGTDYNGTYKIQSIELTQEDSNGEVIVNPNVKVYYTNDESARNANSKDSNLAEGWTEVTSSKINAEGKAIVVKGIVVGQEKVNVDIYLKTDGNKGLDKYVNNASCQVYATTEEMETSNVTTQVVLRTIEGITWYDENNNGIKEDTETIASNIQVSLIDENGNQVSDVNGNILTPIKTDDDGYYKFTDLPMGNYYVRVITPDNTYMLTEKEVGANSTINSKFNVDNNETDKITKLNSIDLPELTESNVNAGFVKKPTKVVVNYLEKGTTTKLLDEYTINGRIDDSYSTTNRLAEVNAAHENKYNYDSVEGQVSGTMVEDTLYITYYFVKKDTKVVVLHVEEGTDVSDPASVTDVLYPTEEKPGKVDDTYNTSAKTDEINAATNAKYLLVGEPTNANGSMTIDTIYVIYVYQKQDTTLIIKHVDVITGEELESITVEGYIGDIVDTTSKTFDGYRLYEKPDTERYTLTEDVQTVTYYYIRQANVITKYVDENTEEEIADRKTDTYDQRSEYDTVKEDITGYTFTKDSENTSGTVDTQDIYVTYYYKKNTSVKAVYVDYYTDEVIADEENFTGLEGDPYATVQKDIDNYVFVEVIENPTGTMPAEPLTVTYKYKKLANVVAKYIDVNTNREIADQESNTYPEQTGYTTPRKSIDGYEFTRDTGNTAGTVGREDIEVIYYYTKKSGITVKYIDYYTGEEIEATEIKNGLEGDPYTTDQKEITNYVFKEVDGDVEGTIPAEPTTITYKYVKQANVYVEYLDEMTGRSLASMDSTRYMEREEYTTAPKNIADYTLTTDSGNTAGTVYRDDIFVKYYYKKNTSLVVKYIDYYTKEIISPTITMTGTEGQEYSTEQKDITDYVFVEVIGKPNGQMDREPQEVIYKYKKQANLITEHIDINTGEKIVEDVVKKYMEKEQYEALGQNFPGYVLVQAPEQTTGTMGREDITKTFYYKKISGGLIVKYVDVLTGELLDQEVYNGNEGDLVTFDKKSFIYYLLYSTPDVEEANLTVEPQEYIYYYIKIGAVNVIGIDQDTREELYRYDMTGVEGEGYEATPRVVDGYTLVVRPNNEVGTYQRNTPDVIYEYKKYSGVVKVEYIDKDTGEILGRDSMSGVIGGNYKTEQRTYEGYRFVNVDGETTGTYSEEEKLVKYYYERKSGRVIVRYITEDGTELEREEGAGKVGEEFHFVEKEFEGYEVVSRPESLDGTYKEGLIELIIVLRPQEVEVETGTIIVNFKDREGNILRKQEVSKDLVGEDYYFEAPDIDGYRIVGDRVVKAKYINGELVYDIIYEKIEEEPIDPGHKDDPVEPEQPKPVEEKQTVDTSDINVLAMLIVLAVSASGITLVKKYKKD